MQNLNGKRVAILATDGFEEKELTEPMKALKTAGAEVEIISLHSGEIQGFQHTEKGKKVAVDKTLTNAKVEDYAALILPGGVVNADAIRIEPKAQAFAQAFDEAQKPIAVICHGAWLLVSAGLVKGRTLTTYHTIKDDIENAGGNWEDKAVVENNNWISSRKPDDLPAFNQCIIQSLSQGPRKTKAA